MERSPSFYLVWNPRGGSPTHRHDTLTAATAEATRLAKANPGEDFIVLQAMRRVAVPPSVIIDDFDTGLTADEVPF